MSSSLPAPEDATSSSALRQNDVDRTNLVVGKSDKKPQSPRPPPRSKSASLLTQALATNYEAEEDAAASSTSVQSPGDLHPPTSTSLSTAGDNTSHTLQNDMNVEGNAETRLHEMAVVDTVPNVDMRAPAHRHEFSTDTSQDVSSANTFSFFSLPRDNFMTSKGRGSSLERTNQEKKVEIPLDGPVTSNPGDTGLSGNVTPQSPTTPDISMNPPTDGMRARYRSWRDARPVAAERTWSIGQQSSEESGQVENSIKDAIAGIGPSNRSRKASHSMRFFKEGLPEDKSKRKDSKNRSHTRDGSAQSRSGIAVDHGISKEELTTSLRNHAERKPPLPSPQRTDAQTNGHSDAALENVGGKSQVGYFDIATGPTAATEELLKSFPAQLLEDIRKNHNLTPGAHKGMSFSQSLPVTESEKSLPDVPLSASPESDLKASEEHLDEDSEAHQSKTDEDDDSGTEHIFSAVFLPHQKAHEEPDEDEEEDQITDVLSRHSTQRPEKSDKAATQQWLEEHEVPSRDPDDKSSSNAATGKALPSPRLPKTPSPYAERDTPYFPETQDLSRADVPVRARTFSSREEYGSQEEQESDTTPTGSLRKQTTISVPKSQEPQPEEKQPLDAIELIPYRHQVGGHTTMWRFSKRAVCKELNNRENEFYENVERLHPKLCKFLPRYIGVLNVSFLEKPRRKTVKKDESEAKEGEEKQSEPPSASTTPASIPDAKPVPVQTNHTRVISQSLQSSSVPIPTVTFAANRHIIPKSLLRPLGPFGDPHYRSKSDSEAPVPKALQHDAGDSAAGPSATDGEYSTGESKPASANGRPTLEDKHAESWGYTIKNKDLRNKVFDEVFLGHPIPVQHHKKGTVHRRSLPHRNPAALRPSNSESNLNLPPAGSDINPGPPVEESMRRRALKTAAGKRNSTLASMTTPDSLESARLLQNEEREAGSSMDDDKTGTSAPEYESKPCDEPQVGKHKRRYSSGGLRRKPTEVAENRGNLKYFEEADDAGYKGDGEEEEVFAMDLDAANDGKPTTAVPHPTGSTQLDATLQPAHARLAELEAPTMLPAPTTYGEPPAADIDIPRPVNPKEAQAQQDARVVYFLLLEDLTAGMKKPCIMDLKMGTRQYGVDANEKKQKSQRQKCEATTSRELGVRVCGLQVWDVKTQTYIFQDKYYGRDLKAGTEFKGALQRFLYDGVDHASVLRRIPTILKKLADLELLVATLKGYRFYAASLLMFYDGDTTEEGESDSTATEKELGGKKKKEIDFKIADFANCVIKEDDMTGRSCPPRHPDEPDFGFLRGLRSLRMYFRTIEKDLQRRELGRSRDDIVGFDGSIDDVYGYDDEGEVSY